MTMLVASAATAKVTSAAGRSAAHRRSSFALEDAGLHLPAELDVRVTVSAADEEAQALGDMEFIRRMRSLVQWAGPGRPVTQTGAMRRGRHPHLDAPLGPSRPR